MAEIECVVHAYYSMKLPCILSTFIESFLEILYNFPVPEKRGVIIILPNEATLCTVWLPVWHAPWFMIHSVVFGNSGAKMFWGLRIVQNVI